MNNYVLIPAGTIIQSASINEPAGWFDCNGRILLKIDYANLFDAIGYTYGGADASFNIPDMRGRVGVGSGTGSLLTPRTLGQASGEEGHVLTVGELPSHNHTLTRRGNEDTGSFDPGNARRDESSAATTDRNTQGTFTTSSVGSGSAHNNMQPYVVLRYLIKY